MNTTQNNWVQIFLDELAVRFLYQMATIARDKGTLVLVWANKNLGGKVSV